MVAIYSYANIDAKRANKKEFNDDRNMGSHHTIIKECKNRY